MRPAEQANPEEDLPDIPVPISPDVRDEEEPIPLDDEFALDHVVDPKDEEFEQQEEA